MVFWLLFVISGMVVDSANADQQKIQLLPNATMEPTKIIYQSYFPLTFIVTVENSNKGIDECLGAVGAQFGIISINGKTKGINIVPSWEESMAETFQLNINFLNGNKNVASVNFTDLPFITDEDEKLVYKIIIDSSVITVFTAGALIPISQAIQPEYLPDFINQKYLSLSFFQPFQLNPLFFFFKFDKNGIIKDDFDRDVNICKFVLDYNGKYLWRPGQPFPYGQI
uniref:Uncharacterized protein n=1 Tax=Panagrolaimus superbus TaxID=310955 RepID=A0A914Z0G1_9BILA